MIDIGDLYTLLCFHSVVKRYAIPFPFLLPFKTERKRERGRFSNYSVIHLWRISSLDSNMANLRLGAKMHGHLYIPFTFDQGLLFFLKIIINI